MASVPTGHTAIPDTKCLTHDLASHQHSSDVIKISDVAAETLVRKYIYDTF